MTQQDYIHVPYGKTVHGEEEVEAVVKVLRTSTQMGKHVREMEERVAQLYGKKYGIMVNSGSSALYLAADLLDYEPGTEIITPVLTFSTTVAPIIKKGWIPVFVDVEEGTYAQNQGDDHPQPDGQPSRLETPARNSR
jgi:CDP-4-dehydro-6-deoxyglucose reductase, E1